jgi:hypothetical protein
MAFRTLPKEVTQGLIATRANHASQATQNAEHIGEVAVTTPAGHQETDIAGSALPAEPSVAQMPPTPNEGQPEPPKPAQ